MKSTRYLNITLFCINAALVVAASQWLGCATPSQPQRAAEAPGMYDVKGYQGQVAYGTGDMWTAGDVDVDGTVGHPFNIGSPTARMVPESASWNGDLRIVSGSLPPGLELNNSNWGITGIPTERGHWIVNIEVDNLRGSDGKGYGGFKQQIRFHITGSGEVTQ